MADMAAAGDAAAEMTATMEAMTPAMTMSFLLPGIGLGLLKGLLIGIIINLVTLIIRKGPKSHFYHCSLPYFIGPLIQSFRINFLSPRLIYPRLEPQYFFV